MYYIQDGCFLKPVWSVPNVFHFALPQLQGYFERVHNVVFVNWEFVLKTPAWIPANHFRLLDELLAQSIGSHLQCNFYVEVSNSRRCFCNGWEIWVSCTRTAFDSLKRRKKFSIAPHLGRADDLWSKHQHYYPLSKCLVRGLTFGCSGAFFGQRLIEYLAARRASNFFRCADTADKY